MEEVKTEVETVAEEVTEEIAEETPNEDDIAGVEGFDYEEDLEYDDDGNVIIPDDEAEADTTAQEEEEPPKEEAPDPRDAELARLRKIEAQAKKTVKSLGYEGEDALDGLSRIAAETEGKSKEEYDAEQEAADRTKAAEALLAKQEAERILSADLAAIKAEFKGAEKFNSVAEFPNIKRFGEMRDLGLSAVEAFRVAQPDIVAESFAPHAVADSKSHLKSAVPKGARDTSITIPSGELDEYRELFPGKSDAELNALYKRATQK